MKHQKIQIKITESLYRRMLLVQKPGETIDTMAAQFIAMCVREREENRESN